MRKCKVVGPSRSCALRSCSAFFLEILLNSPCRYATDDIVQEEFVHLTQWKHSFVQVPPTLRFVLDGEMPKHLLAKDLILQVQFDLREDFWNFSKSINILGSD